MYCPITRQTFGQFEGIHSIHASFKWHTFIKLGHHHRDVMGQDQSITECEKNLRFRRADCLHFLQTWIKKRTKTISQILYCEVG